MRPEAKYPTGRLARIVLAQRSCRDRTVPRSLPVHDALDEAVGQLDPVPGPMDFVAQLVVVRQVVDQRGKSPDLLQRLPAHRHRCAQGKGQPFDLHAQPSRWESSRS